MLKSKTLIHRMTKLGKLLKAVTVLIKSTPLPPKKKKSNKTMQSGMEGL